MIIQEAARVHYIRQPSPRVSVACYRRCCEVRHSHSERRNLLRTPPSKYVAQKKAASRRLFWFCARTWFGARKSNKSERLRARPTSAPVTDHSNAQEAQDHHGPGRRLRHSWRRCRKVEGHIINFKRVLRASKHHRGESSEAGENDKAGRAVATICQNCTTRRGLYLRSVERCNLGCTIVKRDTIVGVQRPDQEPKSIAGARF